MLLYCEVCKAKPREARIVSRGRLGLDDIEYCARDQSAYSASTGQRLIIHGDKPAFYDKNYRSPRERGRLVESPEEFSLSLS